MKCKENQYSTGMLNRIYWIWSLYSIHRKDNDTTRIARCNLGTLAFKARDFQLSRIATGVAQYFTSLTDEVPQDFIVQVNKIPAFLKLGRHNTYSSISQSLVGLIYSLQGFTSAIYKINKNILTRIVHKLIKE